MAIHELVVIGSGPGGYVAALRAAQLGVKVTLIEREKTGGVCLHSGCIPSKALIQGAQVFHTVKRAAEFGVKLPGSAVLDYATLAARKDKVVQSLENGLEFTLRKRGVNIVKGEASFTSARTLNLRQASGSNESMEFLHAIVATGGVPFEPPNLPMDGTTYITSNEVLRWTALPTSIAIIGAGVIGCEFASLYARLGVPVTVIEMLPGALPGFDADVGREVAKGLKKQGVDFFFETKVEEAAYGPVGAALTLSNGDTLSAQVCVVAVGRKPNTAGLHPDLAGLKIGTHGEIPVDNRCRTTVPSLYAIGDVTGVAPLAHTASHMGLVAAEQIAMELKKSNLGELHGPPGPLFDARNSPMAVFTMPEVAALGLTEEKARATGHDIKVGKFPLRALGKALAVGEVDGFVKVIGDAKTGTLLGFHAVGPTATDMLGEASLAWVSEAKLETLAKAIHAHPTFPEAVGEAALLALGRPLHG